MRGVQESMRSKVHDAILTQLGAGCDCAIRIKVERREFIGLWNQAQYRVGFLMRIWQAIYLQSILRVEVPHTPSEFAFNVVCSEDTFSRAVFAVRLCCPESGKALVCVTKNGIGQHRQRL